MKKDNPYNSLLLNMTLVLIFCPLYLLMLSAPQIGLGRLLIRNVAQGSAFAQPLLYIFLLGYIVSLVWLLVRGRIAVPIVLFFLLVLPYGYVATGNGQRRYELMIGAGQPVLGIDVYCNDVHLGKTPLRVTEEELCEKVEPWEKPPRQERFMKYEHDEDYYFWSKYYYVPNDILDTWNEWPPDHSKYNRMKEAESRKEVAETRYWWHFEKDGCVGLTAIANFGGGGGGGAVITIGVSPSTEFLSAQVHLTALLDELAAKDYEASDEWIAHFGKYSGLLFLDFYKKAQSNSKLRPALEAVVRAEFDIPAEPTRADCALVVDAVLDRVEIDGCFTAPSLESVALDMVGKVDRRPIVDRFVQHLGVRSTSSGSSSSGQVSTWRRSGKAARQLPLEYAVKKLRPPELFNRLVYLSARDESFLVALGNYRRPEAIRLIQHYLRQLEQGKGRGYNRRHNVENAIRLFSKIDNPELDERMYWFIRENASSSMNDFWMREFFESRMKSKDSHKDSLAEFIFSWAPLDERQKIQLLTKIDSPAALHYINYFTRFDEKRRKWALEALRNVSNPSMDDFLIESYNWLAEKLDVKNYGNHSEVVYAVVNADSEKVREFLEGKWNESAESRATLIDMLRSVGWTSSHMDWMTPLIAELSVEQQPEAVKILEGIKGANAQALLEKWSSGDNAKLARSAKYSLERRAMKGKDVGSLADKGADLIAGRIKPDDLLAKAVPYIWTDEGYVPEGEVADSQP